MITHPTLKPALESRKLQANAALPYFIAQKSLSVAFLQAFLVIMRYHIDQEFYTQERIT
jgi:hypothetical protein